jgi:hypothetical protein
MIDPSAPPKALPHVEAALEASCESLITLQLMRALVIEPPEEIGRLEAQTNRAIKSLRRAMAELRLACGEQPNMLPVGFVLGRDPAEGTAAAS